MIFETSSIKNYGHIWNQHVRISVIAKFCEETKCLKLGPKTPYLDILDKECLIWVFLGKNFFWKSIVIFEISILKFVYLQNFTKIQKCSNLGAKMSYLGIFDQKCLIWVFLCENFRKLLSYLKSISSNLLNSGSSQ